MDAVTRRPIDKRAALAAGALAGVGALVAIMILAGTARPTPVSAVASHNPPIVISVSGRDAATEERAASGSDTRATVGSAAASRPIERVDPSWLRRTAAATGIPTRALVAYASAQLTIATEQPECGIGWNTLAGIGGIESDHGRHGGAVLGEDGYSTPAIRGIPLDGSQSARIGDTDGGKWDGDTRWDRAVGPLQFIPSTWERWGADGNGDGVSDPNQIDDAALAAARYLCAAGPLTTPARWRAAIFSYNHLDTYVDEVAAAANRYAQAAAPSHHP